MVEKGEVGIGWMSELLEIVVVVEKVMWDWEIVVGYLLFVGWYVLIIFGLIYELIDLVCYIVNCLLGK